MSLRIRFDTRAALSFFVIRERIVAKRDGGLTPDAAAAAAAATAEMTIFV